MRLHLGCGSRCIPGFVHVDLAEYPHVDHRRSVADLSPFADGSADLIYASHVLEYFDRQEAAGILAEWRRVLRPGGTLRLAVPDFPALVQVYQQTADLKNILGPLYGRMVLRRSDGRAEVVYHRTVYDFPSLRRLLEESAFADVRIYDWRRTIHKDYDDHSQAYFPHMDKQQGLLISLNVEAVKP